MTNFGGIEQPQNPHGQSGFPGHPSAPPVSGPSPGGAAPESGRGGGAAIAAGGLLILVAVLFVVGSLLNLAEFHSEGDSANGLPAFHSVWRAWTNTSDSMPGTSEDTQQWLGIPMVVAAVIAAVGGVLLLIGLGARSRAAHAVAAASVATGLSLTVVIDVGSTPLTDDSTTTTSLGAGFWVFVLAAVAAVAALAGVLFGGKATRAAAPIDSYGRPLQRRAGGLDIGVGLLLIPLAGLMVAATFFHQVGPTTLWRSWNDKTQIVGAPLVLGAVAGLISAVLAFTGRGRTAASFSATALFAAGLLLSFDTVDQTLPGQFGFGTFGVGAWLLFAATALALLVMLLAVAASASAPRYRTPYIPAAQRNAGWQGPQQGWGPPAGQAGPAPAPQGWAPQPQGWTPAPQSAPPSGWSQPQQNWPPQQPRGDETQRQRWTPPPPQGQ